MIFIAPLGIFFQNLGAGLILIFLSIPLIQKGHRSFKGTGALLASSLTFIVILTLASLINPLIPLGESFKGLRFVFWALIPCLMGAWAPFLPLKFMDSLKKTLALVLLFWGGLALSQNIWDWKFVGMEIVQAHEGGRAHGLYSHPLSLAYAALLLFPLCTNWCFRYPRELLAWVAFLGCGTLVSFSESRTVQIGVLGFLAYKLLTAAKNKFFALGLVTAFGFFAWNTDSKLKSKLQETFSSKGHDKLTDYPDDRVAFWHAHAMMFLEKPILGHGGRIRDSYRKPYYEKIGLTDFKKNFHSHNTFLQILVEGGILGLIAFLGWAFALLRLSWVFPRGHLARETLSHTLILFGLASLLQNSFQDASTRMVLTFLTGFFVLVAQRSKNLNT
jgi:O-antigen ligase